MAASSQSRTTAPTDRRLQPPEGVRLEEGVGHVWCASPRQTDALVGYLRRSLASEEAERAAGFRFRRHEGAFVVARGLLRVLAGR